MRRTILIFRVNGRFCWYAQEVQNTNMRCGIRKHFTLLFLLMVHLRCGELFAYSLRDSRDSCDFTSVKGWFSFCNCSPSLYFWHSPLSSVPNFSCNHNHKCFLVTFFPFKYSQKIDLQLQGFLNMLQLLYRQF